jgi:hypothetical protein
MFVFCTDDIILASGLNHLNVRVPTHFQFMLTAIQKMRVGMRTHFVVHTCISDWIIYCYPYTIRRNDTSVLLKIIIGIIIIIWTATVV